MQLLMGLSRLLILAGVSFSLLFLWYANDNKIKAEIPEFRYTPIDESRTLLPEEPPIVPFTRAKKMVSGAQTVPSIWSKIGNELQLDHYANSARVKAEIRKLLADPKSLNKILTSSEPYIYFIYEQVKKYNLPAELALIPAIESQFNPNDFSHKGATGLWQLMPATARVLGVKVKPGYDGRRNLLASTKAALVYFRDLGQSFRGDWYLAMAAYNCGQVKVVSAERRSHSRSFWNLRLPLETQLYVPKLLAVAEIIKHPGKYGVKLPTVMNKPYFAELKTKKPVNLKQIAKKSGVQEKVLRTLNPDYIHGVIPIKGSYSLLIPVNSFSILKDTLPKNIIS